jgi:leucyl/phenylalanyl-tRNA--protein transferase
MLLRLRTGNFGGLFSEGIEPEPAPPPATRRLRRQAALRENLAIRTRRLMRVFARLLRPRRVADLPAALELLLRERLVKSANLPNPRAALPAADGLAGLAPDLAPASMMEAYGKGLSPSASLGPVAWHCRAARFVAAPATIAEAQSLSTGDADRGWSVTFDRDIETILARSGRPADHSAIMPARLLDAFAELFDAGFVHCFEVRDGFGQTIGGGFGVAVGGIFTIEGAFETSPGAAALGLSQLAQRLSDWNFTLVECAPGAAWLGAGLFHPMPREDYLALLALHMAEEKVGRWRNDEAIRIAPAPRPEDRRLAA